MIVLRGDSSLSPSGMKNVCLLIQSISAIIHFCSTNSDSLPLFTEKMGKAAPSVFSGARSGAETVLNSRSAQANRK